MFHLSQAFHLQMILLSWLLKLGEQRVLSCLKILKSHKGSDLQLLLVIRLPDRKGSLNGPGCWILCLGKGLDDHTECKREYIEILWGYRASEKILKIIRKTFSQSFRPGNKVILCCSALHQQKACLGQKMRLPSHLTFPSHSHPHRPL